MLSIRPRGGDGPMYAPERDLAYITPTLMAAAMRTLEPGYQDDELVRYCQQYGISDDVLGTAVERMAEAQHNFVSAFDVLTPAQALNLADFTELPYSVRNVVFAAFGRALVGAWFQAVRDVTHIGEVPRAAGELADYYAVATLVSGKLLDRPPVDATRHVAVIEQLKMQVDANGAKLSRQADALMQLRATLSSLTKQLDDRKAEGLWARIRRWWQERRNTGT